MLTALYVPGNRPERFAKAVAAGPDLVVLDLEDAVPVADKAVARAEAVAWTSALPASPVFPAFPAFAVEIRVNGLGTPWGREDLEALAGLADPRVRLPKVESADDVLRVLESVPSARITALIESPLGLERAFDIAVAAPHVVAVALGEADLSSALGVDGDEGLAWARGRLVAASRAAGLGAPMMSVHPHVHDLDALRASCLLGRRLGFVGRAAIHPRQLPVIVEAFTPSVEEVAAAQGLLDAVAAAGVVDGGVTVLPDGRMADPAMVGRAREIVALGSPGS